MTGRASQRLLLVGTRDPIGIRGLLLLLEELRLTRLTLNRRILLLRLRLTPSAAPRIPRGTRIREIGSRDSLLLLLRLVLVEPGL